MDFSKHKLHKYLTEGQAVGTGTQPSMTASTNSSVGAQDGGFRAKEQQATGRGRQRTLKAQKPMNRMSEEYKEMLKEKAAIKAVESQKSNWREELQEKVVDGRERDQHPYVTVMPTGDENLIQAIEQMGKTAKKKEVKEENLEEKRGLWDNIHAKRKRGEAPAKKGDKDYPKTLNVEEVEELEEAKKKCKEGYKYDSEKKKCVKKKKKSSKKSTTVIIGRPLYGGGHHHHQDDHEDDNDGDGGGDSGGGEGGGMGEMFDLLGDMLLKEKYADMSKYKSPETKKIEAQMKMTRENPIPKGRGKVPTKPPAKTTMDKGSKETGGRYPSRYSNSGSD